jgi:hypothetical protein
VSDETNVRLERVRQQLRLYEHPLFEFSAASKRDGVEIRIRPKGSATGQGASMDSGGVPPQASAAGEESRCTACTYVFDIHPRDLDHPQFEWQFQRQLYDALHDYLIEMFVRTPQDRGERRERGL